MAAVSQDAQAVHMAQTTKIPEWNQRMQTALGSNTIQMNIDFNELTKHVTDPVSRHKVISAVVLPSTQTMGIMSTPPAAEKVVKAIEFLAVQPDVKAEMTAQIRSIQFASLPPGSIPDNKSLSLNAGILLYTGAFSDGPKGSFSKQGIIDFLETIFFAQERDLVARFFSEDTGFSRIQSRLQAALPTGPALNFDVIAAIGQASDKTKRLTIARTIISREGIVREASYAVRKTETGVTKAAADVEQSLMGSTSTAVNAPNAAPEKDVFNSPNVLEPLVIAVERFTALTPENAQILGASVREIRVQCQPGATPAENKSIVLLNEKGAVIEPSREPIPPPIRGAVVVINGCFEKGSKGCIGKDTILDFFEKHFRVQERGFVTLMMADSIPKYNGILMEHIRQGVEIEFMWDTIFTRDLAPGDERLDVAKTLCLNGSKKTVEPLVKAIQDIVIAAGQIGPQNPVQQLLQQQVTRIIIESVVGEGAKTAKPSFSLVTGQAGSMLVYKPSLVRGARGVFDRQEAKDALRNLLAIEKPASEKGAQAVLNKGVTELNRLGEDVGKALGKMSLFKGFGKK